MEMKEKQLLLTKNNNFMKQFFYSLILSAFFYSCGKDKNKPPAVDVPALLKGNWQMTQYKLNNEPWKDSTTTRYNFVNDTLVIPFIYGTSCERSYEATEQTTDGLKLVRISPNSRCIFPAPQDGWAFSVVSIDSTSMEIYYPDEIGAALVQKRERYRRL
jgi:hypothetical protein